ncbi:PLP-dependent cysteine synthase family protein [Natronoglycomyces albus]|uniref:cysteine synthase n=1 Tax=Natronoglycomyces albus TaxID=2811108 RepID=A0A895XIR1_9ACTN|nr:cysteine synthase family protein [Natronoglycomyces albus]QSB04847.1 cysteine synthase family protein [Natronoglycomyces albus]
MVNPSLDTALPVVDGIEDLVGSTPLIRLRLPHISPRTAVFAKLEAANPLSSIKDRAAWYMLREAEKRGDLPPTGGVIVEATSGNTGISLAALAASRGHRCVVVLPDNATAERVALLKTLGAQVVQTPAELRYQGAIDKAVEIHRDTEGSWFPCQHENRDNVRAHFETTGPEIWGAISSLGGHIDVLVCGVGTGGTLTGVAGFLKQHQPTMHVVAVEPAGSPVLSGGEAGSHKIPGYNGGFVADTTDTSLIDQIVTVTDEDAAAATRSLARNAGILAGVSSGAAAHVCGELSAKPEYADKTIVTILPDTGERYLSMWTSS